MCVFFICLAIALAVPKLSQTVSNVYFFSLCGFYCFYVFSSTHPSHKVKAVYNIDATFEAAPEATICFMLGNFSQAVPSVCSLELL